MTILAILLAIAIAHWLQPVGQRGWGWIPAYRSRFDWQPSRSGLAGLPGYLWLLGLPVVAVVLLQWISISLLGHLGGFLFGTAVLILALGPRDLSNDVEALLGAESPDEQTRAAQKLGLTELPEQERQYRKVLIETVFTAALRRWFSVVLWFAILGPAGAVFYRLAERLAAVVPAESARARQLQKTLTVMEWPAAQLMTFGLAVATDLDTVIGAWRTWHQHQGHSLFEPGHGFLLAAARRVILGGEAARDGYADSLDGPLVSTQLAMDLVWRVLGVWLFVLALLLLAGLLT